MRPPRYLLLLLLITALALRTYQITYNFDGDEVFSVRTARSSFHSVIETSLWDKPHPPLFNVLLFSWVRLIGHSEAAVRSLSVLLSLGTLLILYRIAVRLSTWSAVWTVGLVALSPFCVFYGRQARPFALAAFLGTLSVLLLLKIYENPESRKWVLAYGLCCAALLYTQYLALSFIGAQIALVLWARFPRKDFVCASASLSVLSVLPWVLIAELAESGNQVRQYTGWLQMPTPSDFAYLFVEVLGELPWKNTSRIMILALFVSLLAIVVHRTRLAPEKVIGLAALGFSQPVAAFLASYALSTSLWAPRHYLPSIMFFLLLVGYSLTLHRKLLSGIMAGFFLVWFSLAIPNAFPANVNPPWRRVSDLLKTQYPQHELVASEGWVQIALEYYSEKPVRLWSESTTIIDSGFIIFVCRPSTCQRIKSLPDTYQMVEEQKFVWGHSKSDPDRTLVMFSFHRSDT